MGQTKLNLLDEMNSILPRSATIQELFGGEEIAVLKLVEGNPMYSKYRIDDDDMEDFLDGEEGEWEDFEQEMGDMEDVEEMEEQVVRARTKTKITGILYDSVIVPDEPPAPKKPVNTETKSKAKTETRSEKSTKLPLSKVKRHSEELRYFDKGEISTEETYESIDNPDLLRTEPSNIEEQQEILKENLTTEEQDIGQDVKQILRDRLKIFRKDGWVRHEIKMSHLYLPTDLELETSFDQFEIHVLSAPANIIKLAAKEPEVKKFHIRLLPFYLSYMSDKIKYFDREEINVKSITDLKAPHEWYQAARNMKRKIILHLGPTNSGKTYSALNRLAEAESGIYCGPLRLLAYEVFEKLNDKDVPCNLLTGQQKIGIEGAQHTSCTVEMADLNRIMDVAVLDEIQMMGHPERGWAWTRAFLGLMAKEIHICGDASAKDIIKHVCKLTGDSYEVKEYTRLSPLKPAKKHIKSVKEIEKGDCIIAFSRSDIYDWKLRVEKETGKKCCIIYGGLPPEARRQQAELFNDQENEYDVLIASDAIGMGLNLNIKRIIFSQVEKYDGNETRPLLGTEVKQIAGRAGRFNSVFPEGTVNSFSSQDNAFIKKSLEEPIQQLSAVGIFPNFEHIEEFSKVLKPGTRFKKIIDTFMEVAVLDRFYFLCDHNDMTEIAKAIELIPLTLKDRYTFCTSPVDTDNAVSMSYLVMYAGDYVYNGKVNLNVDLSNIDVLNPKKEIQELEVYHKICDLYIWHSYRSSEFHQRDLAQITKKKIVERIRLALNRLGSKEKQEFLLNVNIKQKNKDKRGRKGNKRDIYDDMDDFDDDDDEIKWAEMLEEYVNGTRR